ncbi:MAG TPA: MBL fold metallo-hydrolase [Methylibium sp.]|uniref:MBL fold metallo-hydrolase n=1 Tax=Methylibium sp. TaxID=2067992 RepID=UPI002DBFE978|nr:MBL fold metallo-hydrolase [Methylibium sp.]HEU4460821.1 MBL fold metallo-hydrolase [Methylibium sp.]
MNPLEQQLAYPHGQAVPAPGRAVEVAPGVRWLRMGLPFALDHINLWLLRDRQGGIDGWTIVDCGIADASTRAAWEQVFEQELEGLPVLRVIVTHMHPDHIGLAQWLTERWPQGGVPCRLWISATDWNAARMAVQSTTGFGGAAAATHFGTHGVRDAATLDKVRRRSNYFASMVPAVPPSHRRLMDGMVFDIGGRAWRCIAGFGHAPEHISLYCEDLGTLGAGALPASRAAIERQAMLGAPADGRGTDVPAGRAVLISGDMLLPKITTNVSVIDLEPEADPLRLYLDSIERLRALAPDTLVLPSHGRPFVGVPTRIAQIRAHHDERLAEVMEACGRAPCSAFELLPVLFKRSLDLHQTTFALGEAIAHLHALWFAGRLVRTQDAEGVYRFAPA